MTSDEEPDDRAPLEARPDRVPAPEDLDRIKRLFEWIDAMHHMVRRPWGMAWMEVSAMLASLHDLMEWSQDAPVNSYYRYRIDAPLDPEAQVPDEIPEGWET